jgi:hypothetical protein
MEEIYLPRAKKDFRVLGTESEAYVGLSEHHTRRKKAGLEMSVWPADFSASDLKLLRGNTAGYIS